MNYGLIKANLKKAFVLRENSVLFYTSPCIIWAAQLYVTYFK